MTIDQILALEEALSSASSIVEVEALAERLNLNVEYGCATAHPWSDPHAVIRVRSQEGVLLAEIEV